MFSQGFNNMQWLNELSFSQGPLKFSCAKLKCVQTCTSLSWYGLGHVCFCPGGDSQNFYGKFVRFFLTLRCFYRVVMHIK